MIEQMTMPTWQEIFIACLLAVIIVLLISYIIERVKQKKEKND